MTLPVGQVTQIVHVLKRHAKSVKSSLEHNGLLDKRFRMTAVEGDHPDWIAIPITALPNTTSAMILSHGRQFCLYSSSKLGNNKYQLDSNHHLTLVQHALLLFLNGGTMQDTDDTQHWIHSIQELDTRVCPRTLEVIGDDHTLVIPRHAFDSNHDSFAHLIQSSNRTLHIQSLWEILAQVHDSPRVVRRGEIDPQSAIRESGHTILWPIYRSSETTTLGPSSPGWITITEQSISQSFDLTKVMFSRGNVTEKIRFGMLVQPNEVVLDMYAGIGYYTLPALIKGSAKHVYACEWNPNAALALQYNLKANQVQDRATVYIGDSRTSCRDNNICNMVDRVSLGLLPSSEGGWRTALTALRHDTGGWLHVHANVPVQERLEWTWWLCQSLWRLSVERGDEKWIVYCKHVEKVKSFAPTINHYVADIFCGPLHRAKVTLGKEMIGIFRSDGQQEQMPEDIGPPSCALDPNGILNQAWMREEKSLR